MNRDAYDRFGAREQDVQDGDPVSVVWTIQEGSDYPYDWIIEKSDTENFIVIYGPREIAEIILATLNVAEVAP